MNRASLLLALGVITAITCLASTSAMAADTYIPAIPSFSGETTPGVISQMRLAWTYAGPSLPLMRFRIYNIPKPGDTILVADAGATEREKVVNAEPGLMKMVFRIVGVIGDSIVVSAQTQALVAHQGVITEFKGTDTPYDAGESVNLSWSLPEGIPPFDSYKVFRLNQGENGWKESGSADGSGTSTTVSGLQNGKPYHFMVRGYRQGAIFDSEGISNVVPEASWFDWRKINLLIIGVLVLAAVIYFVAMSSTKQYYIRKIAGLEAVEEAVGRATEMGRSVLFVPGINDLDDVQTIAGLTILGSVAKLTAQYETKLDVPVSRSLVMSNGREVVKEAYMSVGRPDFYNDDIVHYITDEQFGYVAALDGIMVREEPAACFYLGAFFAESLILAETGNHVGAIQIAGTAMPTQLPFFVAACDYTLIGEELFAASAYLSKDHSAIAALHGQDVGKLLAMGAMIIGVALTTIAAVAGDGGLAAKASDAWLRLFALNF